MLEIFLFQYLICTNFDLLWRIPKRYGCPEKMYPKVISSVLENPLETNNNILKTSYFIFLSFYEYFLFKIFSFQLSKGSFKKDVLFFTNFFTPPPLMSLFVTFHVHPPPVKSLVTNLIVQH